MKASSLALLLTATCSSFLVPRRQRCCSRRAAGKCQPVSRLAALLWLTSCLVANLLSCSLAYLLSCPPANQTSGEQLRVSRVGGVSRRCALLLMEGGCRAPIRWHKGRERGGEGPTCRLATWRPSRQSSKEPDHSPCRASVCRAYGGGALTSPLLSVSHSLTLRCAFMRRANQTPQTRCKAKLTRSAGWSLLISASLIRRTINIQAGTRRMDGLRRNATGL